MALYLVGTPIGNLGDITARALDTLRVAPVIIAEKWSDSAKLLKVYDIKPAQTISYDENNHHRVLPKILAALEQGDAAYITSAGMSGISDPGLRLVQACREAGVSVIPIPGPSALSAAIAAAGIAGPYLFIGFPPRKEGPFRKLLTTAVEQEQAVILFESTHRIEKTLKLIADHFPTSQVFIGKEMTKQFEHYLCDTAEALLERFRAEPKLSKGEFTLIIKS